MNRADAITPRPRVRAHHASRDAAPPVTGHSGSQLNLRLPTATVAALVFFLAWDGALQGSRAATPQSVSPVVGIHRVTLVSGPNCISVPFHNRPSFRGTVASATATSVTFSGSPDWTANQFGPRDGMPQFVVVIINDASDSPGVAGDWWHIASNTAATLTVDPGLDNLATHLGAGDVLEVRRLTSIQDVFGSGDGVRLNKDSDFDILISQEDVIRFVEGTSFTTEIFFHDGTLGAAGYYVNGNQLGNGDGSTITLNPGQPIVVFRRTGSEPLVLTTAGVVQTTPFTHYLDPGPNPRGMVFPVDSPVVSSRLKESGWVSDLDFDVLRTQEDICRAVLGTSFTDQIFHYEGLDAPAGWYVNGTQNDTFAFRPTTAYVFFVRGPAPLVWRQAVPFDPP